MIEGDSGEYEFLKEAVYLSKDVEGILAEVGLRLGEGTKNIVDAAEQCRPGSTVLSIDPFGSILYVGREHIGPIRLDYTNDMYKQVLADMSLYVLHKNINWIPFKMTDKRFFESNFYGVELYELETTVCNKYSMVHLDGPHNYEHVSAECIWFNDRMDIGATMVIDDCTPDFIQIEPINQLLLGLGWELYKQGSKKNLYIKSC